MDGFFSNYRINKNIDRTGLNLLIKNIQKRTKISSIIVFSAINKSGEQINENWSIKKQSNGKIIFNFHNEKSDFIKMSKNFRTSVLNYLTTSNSIIFILVSNMKQKIDTKKTIQEMWGFKIEIKKGKTFFSEKTSEEIYKYSTTSAYTGKSIPPQKELVYCGPDGKICGWDML